MLSEHPGDSPVYLQVGSKTIRLPGEFNVNCDGGIMGELRAMLGSDILVG